MTSNQNEVYDDDEKYWYQSKLPNRDIFDDNVGFESLLNAAKEVASLNKTRLDLIGDKQELFDSELSKPNRPIEQNTSLQSSGSYSLADTGIQSARYNYAKRATVATSNPITTSSVDEIYKLKTSSIGKQNWTPTYQHHFSDPTGRIAKFAYNTCLPMSFYNPGEYDVDQLDYKKIVIDLMLNRPTDLSAVKTRAQKECLIKHAIRIGDGNAIFPAIIHLKNTMSGPSFYQLLKGKSWLRGEEASIACNHYVTYLKVFEDSNMITRELQNIGLVEEAMNRNSTNSDNIEEFIGRQYKDLLTILGGLKNVQYGKLISQQMFFLDVKKRLFHDMRNMPASNTYFQQLAKTQSPRDIVKFTVMYPKFTLEHIDSRFGLTEQESAFIQLECYADQKNWLELTNSVVSRDLGKRLTTQKNAIPWAIIADIASDAPKEVLVGIISYISNPISKFECAEHHECFEYAVDILATEIRDRKKLDAFKNTLARDSPAYMKATQYISTMVEQSANESSLTSSGVFNSAMTTGAEMASGLNAMWKKERSKIRDFLRRKQ
ncbi:hypothetical protein GJ496_005063 [Pomphorhynchus laevis]|nr:hypothetical protein GJ496_005063 [Pomphorhynchus laevis]